MNISHPLGGEVLSVSFACYTPDEIKKVSVKQISNPDLFDRLGQPITGGLYDLALGPFDRGHICQTCMLDYYSCPGHFGHIELPCPVYNTLFFTHMYSLLKGTCLKCHNFKLHNLQSYRFAIKLLLLERGLLIESMKVDAIMVLAKDEDLLVENQTEQGDIPNGVKLEAALNLLDEFLRNTIRKSSGKFHKTTTLETEKRRIIKEFLKACSALKRCENCHSPASQLRKDGSAKIFQLPPSKKYIKKMQAESDNGINNEQGAESSQEFGEIIKDEKMPFKQEPKFLTPLDIRYHLRALFSKETKICHLLYGLHGPFTFKLSSYENKNGLRFRNRRPLMTADIFFLEMIAVPPVRFRPAAVMGDSKMENPQNQHFRKVIQTCAQFSDLNVISSHKLKEMDNIDSLASDKNLDALINIWINLQHAVNGLIDSSKILEKKEGLFRKHMMGKRVNYAARSVISPDPNVETDEIGVPVAFAKVLTYPEPVTECNINEMRQAVINGPEKWPGAVSVQHEDGMMQNLGRLSFESRVALANQLLTPHANTSSALVEHPIRSPVANKKVFRHLRTGDMLLLNRQPTLHKPSIMAHRARVLPGEMTIRMHYANCKSYNADFDGDEMNMHFPQNEMARAEAGIIGNANEQYLVPTTGAPLRGLMQDHVVMGVWMTLKDTFFRKEEYHQILYNAMRPEAGNEPFALKVLTVPPAILKPQKIWTGKQVITTILKNLTVGKHPLNVTSKANIPQRFWGGSAREESIVIFKDGELLTGVLDKGQFGATAFGLVHSCYELYSPFIAGKLLSILGRLFTAYSQVRGFSCCMDDLRLTEEGDQARNTIIENARNHGTDVAYDFVGLDHTISNKKESRRVKIGMAITNLFKIYLGIPFQMEEVFHDDQKQRGLDAAMKSKMNILTSSIIEHCIPDKLLIRFPGNNMQMMTVSGAKGTNVNVAQISCALGQQELEGRRVPVMVSGKSLPSFLPYDTSARAGGFIGGRFLTGIKPQEYFFHCMAGREGLIDTAVKTSRSGYLQRCLIKHLESLRVHYDHTVRDSDGSVIQFHYGEDSLDIIKKKHLYQFKFNLENYAAFSRKYQPTEVFKILDTQHALAYSKKALKRPEKYDPVLSIFPPSRHLGSVSEKFEKALNKYVDENLDYLKQFHKNKINENEFKSLMRLRYMYSLVEPGESVGLLAAQSVGEPSTQMTLNTFHFAGFGAKNVTLGIPRLREIIMTASKHIKTPIMNLPLRSNINDSEANKFSRGLSRLTLADVLEEIAVTERLGAPNTENMNYGRLYKLYIVRLNFFSKEEYMEEYHIKPIQIQTVIERSFLKKLESSIKKILKGKEKTHQGDESDIAVPYAVTSDSRKEKDAVDDSAAMDPRAGYDSDDGDGDATNEKMSVRRKQFASYEEPDEDDLEIIRETNQALDHDDEFLGDPSKENSDLHENLKGNRAEAEAEAEARDAARAQRITGSCSYVTNYIFDRQNGAWCEIHMQFPVNTKKLLLLGLAEKISSEIPLQEIRGVNKCYVIPNEYPKTVAAEGINLPGVWNFFNIIDVNKIYTNDIAAILDTYGVEAARAAIIKEISNVFGVYGISVDNRHISLIADYMTFEGGYKPFSRVGIESNVSPFLKMSYETTCHFLTQATLHGDFDNLKSPSARLVVGKVVECGTGSFTLINPLENRKRY
ncbi:hypothetical protein G9A89_021842 [Geosiphon pyriformis]|nr:hypothetical protein G9A89_021842 [Geosiphon pyriformis]